VVNHYSGSGCYNCGGWNAGGAAAVGGAGLAVGAAAGAAVASAARPAYAVGEVYPTLPAGCAYTYVGGAPYYNCGGAWFSPYYGANGTYYRAVGAP